MRGQGPAEGPCGLPAFLSGVDLEGFNVRQPPRTEALFDEQLQGLRGVAWWWNRVMEDGELPQGAFESESDWPAEVDRDLLYPHYEDALRRARFKGDVVSRRWFARELDALGVTLIRRGKGGRERVFIVPPLDECRLALRAYLGSY